MSKKPDTVYVGVRLPKRLVRYLDRKSKEIGGAGRGAVIRMALEQKQKSEGRDDG